MQLYVPEIGDYLRLSSDWHFKLYNESRNMSLWLELKCSEMDSVKNIQKERKELQKEINDLDKVQYTKWTDALRSQYYDLNEKVDALIEAEVMLPEGCLLAVDRIFIRKGLEDWSSLTFYLHEHPTLSFKRKPRFWVKLEDCNTISFLRGPNINTL